MRMLDVAQGSAEWYQARLGVVTASEFDRVVTPTGKLSAQARRYAYRLVAERLLNRTLDSLEHLDWVAHGREHEAAADLAYQFEQDMQTAPAGFYLTDDGRVGASPDRLVGGDGLLEVKCPAPQTHIGYLLDGFDAGYRPQVQGQLLVTERDWCDWYSWSPEMPSVRVRAYRDEPYLARLRAALDEFCDMKDELQERARAAGVFAQQPRVQTPHEYERADG